MQAVARAAESLASYGSRRNGLALVRQLPLRGHNETYRRGNVSIYLGAAEEFYEQWPTPTCIIVDGPYGVAGFDGDLPTAKGLDVWYTPHVEAWSKKATPQTTLWFWGTELGWATVHPVIAKFGWEYRNCHVWNKGIGHIAGNANTKTLRKFPVVTEVCVQYVKPATFPIAGRSVSMQEWLRHEWMRSGLPMYLSNKACGVKNAATRKYLTSCHLWYYPPVEAFERMAAFVNKHGDKRGRPYFSVNAQTAIPGEEWERLRAKFYCEVGITNSWDAPALHGPERVRIGGQFLHTNQKPMRFMETIIRCCTDENDVIWEPFGGLFPAAVAAHKLRRRYVGSEISREFFTAGKERLATYDANGTGSERAEGRLAPSRVVGPREAGSRGVARSLSQ